MKRYQAFSSVEMGVTVILILAVMSIIVLYFNPSKMVSQKRNDQRTDDVTEILNALTQYAGDNNGTLPEGIPVSDECTRSEYELCKTGAADCSNKVVLSGFSSQLEYLPSMPVDPKSRSTNGTGYNIVQNESGRVTVCAPLSELGTTVSLSK
ncbi:type II secretion system protein [bacterium]|nr:type II secretion system protein [bacterium]